jgi:hypothetical protein
MNTGVLLKTSFVISACGTFIAALIFALFASPVEPLFIIAIIATLIFMLTAIYEVTSSNRISRREKIIWIIGFVLMNTIVGLIYLLSERRRIVAKG